ncbi:MAG: hypothetical protein AMXMBFR83_21840 [Phycisphaerae bacterium]
MPHAALQGKSVGDVIRLDKPQPAQPLAEPQPITVRATFRLAQTVARHVTQFHQDVADPFTAHA